MCPVDVDVYECGCMVVWVHGCMGVYVGVCLSMGSVCVCVAAQKAYTNSYNADRHCGWVYVWVDSSIGIYEELFFSKTQ